MLIKKYDTKNFYPLFWAAISVFVIIIPHYIAVVAKNPDIRLPIVWGVALIAGVGVFFKSGIDLIQYKRVSNRLMKQNIEILINSSVGICNSSHKDKKENFFGEFLRVDKSKGELKSIIRSKNFEKEISKYNDRNFSFDLPIGKGYAGRTFAMAEIELRNFSNRKDWNSKLFSEDAKFPMIFESKLSNKEFLLYSEDEMNFLCETLEIRSVIACPVVIFRKKWYKKSEEKEIIGILLYTSNLEIPENENNNEKRNHSSLSSYRLSILKQVRFIAEDYKVNYMDVNIEGVNDEWI